MDATAGWSDDQRFFIAIGIFIGAMLARSVLLYFRDMMLVRLQAEHEASMQWRAASALASRGWPFASRIGQSGMQSLLLIEISRAATAVAFGQQAIVRLTLLAVQLALAAFLSLKLALIALTIIAAGYALSWPWFRKGSRAGVDLSDAYDRSAAAGFRLHAGLKAALAQEPSHTSLPSIAQRCRGCSYNLSGWHGTGHSSGRVVALQAQLQQPSCC